jgi:Rod binding domain-containing protein
MNPWFALTGTDRSRGFVRPSAAWGSGPRAGGEGAGDGVSSNPAKNEKAARDFEALLLTPVLESLQKTFSGSESDQTPGAADYHLMATQALAQSMAARGGIGIGELILRHLQPPKVSGGE